MAFGDLYSGGSGLGPKLPSSQGYQGQTAQPNSISYNQGPAGSNLYSSLQGSVPQKPPAGPAGPPPSSAGTSKPVAGSPVTSTGQIQPQSAAAPQSAPPTPDPFASLGGGIYQNGGWVMKGMTQNGQVVGGAPAGQPQAGAASGGPYQPSAPNPWGPWPGRPQDSAYTAPTSLPTASGPTYTPTAAPGFTGPTYNPAQLNIQMPGAMPVGSLGSDPFTSYQGGTISQFQQPGMQNFAAQQGLMASLLQNPDVISPEVLAAMRGQSQDQIAQMAQQRNDLAAQNAAARGFSPTRSGQVAGDQRRVMDTAQGQLLASNRDLGVQAAQMNAANRQQVAGLSDQLLNSEAARASGLYNTGLQGQMAQQGVNQNAASSQQAAQGMALQRALQQAGLAQNAAQFDLARAGFGLQQGQLNNQNQLDAANFGLNRDQLGTQQWGMANQNLQNAAQLGLGKDAFNLQSAMGLEGLKQNAAGTKADAYNTDLNAYFQNKGLDINKALGEGGLNLDQRRLAESGRQFDLGQNLNWAALLNDMVMGRANYGAGLAGLQQAAQNGMFSQFFGGK